MKKKKNLAIINDDPWLEPYSDAINGRHQDAVNKIAELTDGTGNLAEFANAYNYYGLHRTPGGWVFREWAPNATEIYLVGQFNDWKECAPYRLKRLDNGNWEIVLPERAMRHGDLYKLRIHWQGGEGERIPAYATRVVHSLFNTDWKMALSRCKVRSDTSSSTFTGSSYFNTNNSRARIVADCIDTARKRISSRAKSLPIRIPLLFLSTTEMITSLASHSLVKVAEF